MKAARPVEDKMFKKTKMLNFVSILQQKTNERNRSSEDGRHFKSVEIRLTGDRVTRAVRLCVLHIQRQPRLSL